jgi:RHS repeat-associated protein
MKKIHPDYLGHNELITDRSGNPYQYFHYTAWGESFAQAEASQGSFSSSYQFNAKELDQETGNYYYGARYYHPKWSVWLSVDPIIKYHESPYSFTSNNPIILIDPDGKDTRFAGQTHLRQMVFNLINPNSQNYDRQFSSDFSELVESEVMFKFKHTKGKNSNVDYNGNEVIVSIGDKAPTPNSSVEAAVFEEVEHCIQLLYGEYGFTQQFDGTFGTVGLDQEDEANGFLRSLEAPCVFPSSGGSVGRMRKAAKSNDYDKMLEVSTARSEFYSTLPKETSSADSDAKKRNLTPMPKDLILPLRQRVTPINRLK